MARNFVEESFPTSLNGCAQSVCKIFVEKKRDFIKQMTLRFCGKHFMSLIDIHCWCIPEGAENRLDSCNIHQEYITLKSSERATQ